MDSLKFIPFLFFPTFAFADNYRCDGIDTSNGNLVQQNVQITPEYYIIDERYVFEYLNNDEEYIIYVFDGGSEVYLIVYNPETSEFYNISMPLLDFIQGYQDRIIIYAMGNCTKISL